MRNVKWLKKTAAMLLAGTLMCGTAAWTGAGLVQEVKAREEQTEPPVIDLSKKGTLKITKRDGNTQEALNGAGFTMYQVMKLEPDEKTGFYTYTPQAPFKAVLEENNVNADTLLKEYSAQKLEKLAKQLAAAITDDTLEAKAEQKTEGNGETLFQDIDLGYYLVVETTAPTADEESGKKYIAGMPFLAAFPYTSEDGSTWKYDAEAIPKNYSTSIDKEINTEEQGTEDAPVSNDGTVAVGDFVPYKITTQTPNYADELYKDAKEIIFKITDTMDSGLKMTNNEKYPVLVTVGEQKLTENEQYTVKISDVDGEADLTVTFDSEYLKAEGSNKEVVITYYAEVLDSAVTGKPGNSNSVKLEYTNQPGEKTEIVPGPEIDVYTFDLNVVKFTNEDGGTPRALEGAKFELRKADPKGELVESEKPTDLNGKISFGKLDAGLYYLVETKAPAGYTLLANPIKVEIIAAENGEGLATDGSFTLKINDQEITAESGSYVSHAEKDTGVAQVAVENHKGFTLPQTGGMGIMLFLAVGVAGIVVVSVLLTRKSKDAK